MPLIRDGHFTQDDWTPVADDEPFAAGAKAVVSLKRFIENGARGIIGVEIPNNADIKQLQPHFSALELIAVQFPAFNDGRGFTLARRLRRLGFKGELRAKGHIIPDQYAYALACGFDTIEISDALAKRQPEPHWREAVSSMSLGYQPGYPGPVNILEARRSAH